MHITDRTTADSYLVAIFANLLIARARVNLARRAALAPTFTHHHTGLRFHWQTAFDLVGGPRRLTAHVRRRAAEHARACLVEDRRLRQYRCSICKETLRVRTL